MEVIVFWFLSMAAMNSEIEKTNGQVRLLEAEVITLQIQNDIVLDTLEDHEHTILKTAGAHSSFYAGQQLKNETFKESIDLLIEELGSLKEKSE
jgi:hypothetical protein